jgi:hypothetical protein
MLGVPEAFVKFASEHYSKNIGILPYYSIVASMIYKSSQSLNSDTLQYVKKLGKTSDTMFYTILQVVKCNFFVINKCEKHIMKELIYNPGTQYKIIAYDYDTEKKSPVFYPLEFDSVMSRDDAKTQIETYFQDSINEDCIGLGSYIFYNGSHWKIVKKTDSNYILESLDDSSNVVEVKHEAIKRSELPAQTKEQIQNRSDYFTESQNIYVNKIEDFKAYLQEYNSAE